MASRTKKNKPPKQEHPEPGRGGLGGGMERLHQEVGRLLQSREFATVDDVNAFLQEKLLSGQLNAKLGEPRASDDPIELAQELCWQAMDAPTTARARKLYEEALRIDPDCTDALIHKAEHSKSIRRVVEVLERAVLGAADRLGGKEFFQEHQGHFWGLLETRPYMRAKAALAEAYAISGRLLDAIAEYEHMLVLCPNDNLGVRYILLGHYLRCGEVHRTRQLLDSYQETSAVILYGRMILAVLVKMERPTPASR